MHLFGADPKDTKSMVAGLLIADAFDCWRVLRGFVIALGKGRR